MEYSTLEDIALGKKERARITEFLQDKHYDFNSQYGEEEEEGFCTVCGRTTDAYTDACGEVCATLWSIWCDNGDGTSECLPWILAHARRAFGVIETHNCYEAIYG